jgi:hypothetical protein
MNVQKGISVFSALGIVGALIFATIPLWYALWSETIFLSSVDIIAHTLLLIGMIGVYFGNADKLGKFGLVSGILVVIGFVFHIFMKATSGFVIPFGIFISPLLFSFIFISLAYPLVSRKAQTNISR